jgi:alpha-D-xyloside xylohydrolase
MMRSHGTDAPREIYQFGEKGNRYYDAIEKYINLRYRFLPYIYSTSWDVTASQSSMMRAFVMDFPNDKKALDINDEYMFGKSVLVSPVTRSMYARPVANGRDTVQVEDFSTVQSKETYLPAGTDWYDFWTGAKLTGGNNVSRQTPLDIIPLYIKAGSILPVGPAVQYAEEKKWDSLEVRVYPGANGKFLLYEDENDNYNYEKGIYSTILFSWDDAKQTLTIGDRNGSFPGMLEKRTFSVVLGNTERAVTYTGKKMIIKL